MFHLLPEQYRMEKMDESGVSSGDEMINLQDSHDLFASDTDDPMGAELSDSNEDENNTSAVSGGVDTSADSGASMDVVLEVLPICNLLTTRAYRRRP